MFHVKQLNLFNCFETVISYYNGINRHKPEYERGFNYGTQQDGTF